MRSISLPCRIEHQRRNDILAHGDGTELELGELNKVW